MPFVSYTLNTMCSIKKVQWQESLQLIIEVTQHEVKSVSQSSTSSMLEYSIQCVFQTNASISLTYGQNSSQITQQELFSHRVKLKVRLVISVIINTQQSLIN